LLARVQDLRPTPQTQALIVKLIVVGATEGDEIVQVLLAKPVVGLVMEIDIRVSADDTGLGQASLPVARLWTSRVAVRLPQFLPMIGFEVVLVGGVAQRHQSALELPSLPLGEVVWA
jgi:hypothetical protein